MSNPLRPLLHNSNTRTWFIDGDRQYYAGMVSIQRIIIDDTCARVLLKSYAVIGDTEPNKEAFPLMHYHDGMNIEVRYADFGRPDDYRSGKAIAIFEALSLKRSWVGKVTSLNLAEKGLIPVWVEVWSDKWQLEFS